MVSSNVSGARFFGLDLERMLGQWRAAAALLLGIRPFSWLLPAPVMALHADGGISFWRLSGQQATPLPERPAHVQPLPALALPADQVLLRELRLPQTLSPADIEQAVQLDLQASNPFPADEVSFGYVVQHPPGQGLQVWLAMASRQHVEQALRDAGFDPEQAPEVWALPQRRHGDQPLVPIVLRGWGQGRRRQQLRTGLLRRLLVLGMLLLLLAALFITPALFMRERAIQAQQAFSAVQQDAAPQIEQREQVMGKVDRLQQLRAIYDDQLAAPRVLDMLTQSIPDGAWLNSLRMEGRKLVLRGFADDATLIVRNLARQPGAHDVRLASPATRRAGADKETFIIEMSLDAAHYGVILPGVQNDAESPDDAAPQEPGA